MEPFYKNLSLLYGSATDYTYEGFEEFKPWWGCEQENQTMRNCALRYGPYEGILPENETRYVIPNPDAGPNDTVKYTTRVYEAPDGNDRVKGTACACAFIKAQNWTRSVTVNAFENPPIDVLHIPATLLIVGLVILAVVAVTRLSYKYIRTAQYKKSLLTVVPKPYFPTSGSVWSLKRYQYHYPVEMQVIQPT